MKVKIINSLEMPAFDALRALKFSRNMRLAGAAACLRVSRSGAAAFALASRRAKFCWLAEP